MYKFTLVLILSSAYCCSSQPLYRIGNQTYSLDETCRPDSQETIIFRDEKDLDEECREHLFGSPVSRYDAIEILRSSLALLNDASGRPQRTTRYLKLARNLVRMIINEQVMFPEAPDEPTFSGRSFQDSDPDYTPPKGEKSDKHRFSDNSARLILGMVGRNMTTKSIQAQYPRFRPSRIPELRKQLSGESQMSRFEDIDQHTRQRVRDARLNLLIVRGWMIKLWATEHARSIGATTFKASDSWLYRFNKKHGFKSRKIGKRTSRAKEANAARIESTKFKYIEDFERQRIRFHNGLIFNFDQSGFEYEMSSDRTMSIMGEKDTIAIVDQSNKATHSYTIQPVISRDGRMLNKLLICLKETKGSFGPQVVKKVRDLEQLFGNVYIVSSTSGKMSVALMKEWVNEILVPQARFLADKNPPPARNESEEEWHQRPGCSYHIDGSSGARIVARDCPPVTALVTADSWGGNTNNDVQALMGNGGITFLRIPEGTTNELQPCDIEIFRQWKYLARRLTMQAHFDGFIGALTSRAGVVNLHSLIHNQMSSPRYEDVIRYSWRHADRSFSREEVSNKVLRSSDINFSFEPGARCEHEDCEAYAFIECSHCGKLLCARHFFERVCFHQVNDTDRDEIDFDDDEFDKDLMN